MTPAERAAVVTDDPELRALVADAIREAEATILEAAARHAETRFLPGTKAALAGRVIARGIRQLGEE